MCMAAEADATLVLGPCLVEHDCGAGLCSGDRLGWNKGLQLWRLAWRPAMAIVCRMFEEVPHE